MTGSQRLLAFGGLALALWGMGYGLYYAVFVEHQTLDSLGSSLTTAFVRAAERKMPESQASLDAYAATAYAYVRHVDAHGHWIGLAMLLIVLGVAFDLLGFDERKRFYLALALLVGSASFPLGVLLETVNTGPGPKAVAVAGSALVVLGLSGVAFGFARGAGAGRA